MTRQSWQLWESVISDKTINEIENLIDCTNKASTFNNNEDSVRHSYVCWLSQHEWIRTLLFNYVDYSNQHAFNVNIYKKCDIQFTEYRGSDNGHYDCHHDINWNNDNGFDRKLTVVLQLSESNDYEGGDFLFNEVENPDVTKLRNKGSILIFPSYLQHMVLPVTSGTRKSLVAWFEGPQWQ